MPIRSLCVFCGSSFGRDPIYRDVAQQVGRLLATHGITLVYGGGDVGLMGSVADAAMAEGGTVIGVIPQSLADREVAHHGITDLRVVGSMHERKAMMAELSDGFVALPGGFGTFEEFCEIITWAQLGLHTKPCALLNVAGYFDPLLKQFDDGVRQEFIRPEYRRLVLSATDVGELLNELENYVSPVSNQWIDRSQS